MNREQMLDSAKETVIKHRQNQYGTPEDNFARIAEMWSTYLGKKIEPHDVANMMILLKVVRSQNMPSKEDSWLDMAGYAACGCEIATTKQSVESSLDEQQVKVLDSINGALGAIAKAKEPFKHIIEQAVKQPVLSDPDAVSRCKGFNRNYGKCMLEDEHKGDCQWEALV